jgi:hypothetical protein
MSLHELQQQQYRPAPALLQQQHPGISSNFIDSLSAAAPVPQQQHSATILQFQYFSSSHRRQRSVSFQQPQLRMHRQQQRFCATLADWLQRQSSSLSALCDSLAAATTSSTSAASATPMLIDANAAPLFSATSATIGFSDNAAACQRCVTAEQQQHLHQHLRHLQRP